MIYKVVYHTCMYPNTFYRVSVKALIQDEEGRVLVVKEDQDAWSLPGGGLEHGEDPVDGVLRELSEELGIRHANVKSIARTKTFYLESIQTWLMWVVYATEIDNDDFTYGDGVTAAAFVDITTLASSNNIFERMVYDVIGNN